MPFLGNAGQLTHIFVTTLGENNGNGDKNVSIDGAVKASDFQVQAGSIANIAPNLQAVMEQSATTSVTLQLANPTTSLIASGEVIATTFRGSGSGLTNIPAAVITGSLSPQRIGTATITVEKLATNAVITNKVADSAITTSKIEDLSVTGDKVANSTITAAKIANRSVTSEKIANGAVTADKIAPGAVGTAFIGDGNVTTPKIADLAITTTKLADNAVTTAKLTDSSITTSKINDTSVTTAKLGDASVTTTKLGDTSVTSTKLSDAAVTTTKISDQSVTAAKIANGTITGTQIQDLGIPLSKLESTELTLGQIENNQIAGSKLQRHTVTGGSASLIGDNRSEIGLLTIHNDNIQNATIDVGKLNNTVTLQAVTTKGASTDRVVSITNTTPSSSTGTGALKVSGGLGVAGAVHATNFIGDGSGLTGVPTTLQAVTEGGASTDQVLSITNTTPSSSTGTGALKVSGGLGVGGAVHATNFIGDGSGLTGLPLTLQEVTEGGASTNRVLSITNTTPSTSTGTGALRVSGGLGVGGAVHATNFIGDGSGLTGLPLTLQEVTEGGASTDQVLSITNTTPSTSTGTGAVVITGGLGVGGAVYATSFIGDGSGLTGVPTTLQTVTSGSGNSSSNKILLTNSEDATSGQTGALQVTTGGLSVAKNIYVGKDVIVSGDLVVNGTTTTVDSTSLTVRDTIISLGQGNDSGSKDVGLLFGKSNSNVAIFYDTSDSKLKFGLTNSDASSNQITLDETGNLPIDISGPVTATSFTGSINGDDIDSGTINVNRLPDASTIAQGVVQLNNLTTSTSITQAATANAVKTAYDRSSWSTGSFTSATASLSTGTGAVVITGGLGVGGAVYATSFSGSIDGDDIDSGTINVNRLPDASTTAQGVVQLNNLTTSTSTTQAATANAVKTAYDRSSWSTGSFTSTTASSSKTTGAVVITGGLGVGGAVYATSFSGSIDGDDIDSGTINVNRLPDASTTVQGVVQLNNATNSTSTTQAATASAVKSAYDRSSWSTGVFTSITDSTSTTTGALQVRGGLGVSKKIYAGDDITAFSDKRFKSNIERIESALDKVCQMGGYTFDHRGERKTGVLAQEVKEVLPEAVYGSEETTYSVAYGNLAGILIEAIKELRNEIQQLK
jgi:hypothetical protein